MIVNLKLVAAIMRERGLADLPVAASGDRT
jgi:hypothetical protein